MLLLVEVSLELEVFPDKQMDTMIAMDPASRKDSKEEKDSEPDLKLETPASP